MRLVTLVQLRIGLWLVRKAVERMERIADQSAAALRATLARKGEG